MKQTDVIVIGGGQAGLAMSRCLEVRGIDHIVLERGRIAERWRSERWNSLRLLTPNWQTRLPGYRYRGDDPDGFMSCGHLVEHLEGYARSLSAPVECQTTVLAVRPFGVGYRVMTDRGDYQARCVVLATGYCDRPHVPDMASQLDKDVKQVTTRSYRSPDALEPGGVLVVGASATGVQLADEIQRSGRPVTLAVGDHVRLPRRYRDRDIMWWLDRMGLFRESATETHDLQGARRAPSLQLVGRDDHRNVDLPALQARGVRLCGRVQAIEAGRVHFAGDLELTAATADRRLLRLLNRADAYAAASGLSAHVGSANTPVRFRPQAGPSRLDLRAEGIGTVVWATGFRRSYPWLQVPGALDARGELAHDGGVMTPPGLYALGLQFMRRRNSSFIDGVGLDAAEISEHLAEFIGERHSHAA